MLTSTNTRTPVTARRSTARVALAGGLVFLVVYLASSYLSGMAADRALPMPTDPGGVVRGYYADETAAVLINSACMLISVGGLAAFMVAFRRGLGARAATARARWGNAASVFAVAALVVSMILTAVLTFGAASMTDATAGDVNMAIFWSGGTAHVAALGAYTWLVGGRYDGLSIRVLAAVAAVPAVLSLLSLAIYTASALILLGRLLCMVWTVAAAISLMRAARRADPA